MAGPALAPDPIVEVRDVHTRAGRAVIHDGVSLEVRRGEIFAVAGASGSGKSTLLREMILLRRPEAGTLRVLGQDLGGLGEDEATGLRRRWGVMFAQGGLFGALTVAQNVALPLREHTRLREPLVSELAALKIALAGLPPEAGAKYPAELSSGMRKRAALARALALDPELLFLDEPTSGLDPLGAGAFDELVLRLKRLLGLTILVITHDLDFLWRVADRVALLVDGRVVGTGTMEELSRSGDPRVREYFHGPRGRAAREGTWTTG